MAERPLLPVVLYAGDPALLCGPFPGLRCEGRAGGRAAPHIAARHMVNPLLRFVIWELMLGVC